MNITLLLNRDSASTYALSLLAPNLKTHTLSVFYTDKPSRQKPVPRALVDLAIFEKIQLSQLSSVLLKFNAERLNDVNGIDLARLKQSKPDLIISVRHMSILTPEVINVATHGVLNLHSGLLPCYQGVMATFWAMKNIEDEVGTTLHRIEDSGIDTGAVIAQSHTTTRFDKSYFWNVLNIYQDGCANVISAINVLNNSNELLAKPQSGPANYYSYPNADDLAKFEPMLFSKNDLDDFL